MPAWQLQILLVLTAVALQILETKVRVGKAQSVLAWLVGITSTFLVLGAGVLASRGWAGSLTKWAAGLGSWIPMILGILGVASMVLVVLAVLPQGISADVTSTMTLVAAGFIPSAMPYTTRAIHALLHVALPAAADGVSRLGGS
jgi:hypothetical protein